MPTVFEFPKSGTIGPHMFSFNGCAQLPKETLTASTSARCGSCRCSVSLSTLGAVRLEDFSCSGERAFSCAHMDPLMLPLWF